MRKSLLASAYATCGSQLVVAPLSRASSLFTPSEHSPTALLFLHHRHRPTRLQVLKVVFDKTFPGVAPHPPSDPYLDRMAAWQEQREAQVVANAKVLAGRRRAERGAKRCARLSLRAASMCWVPGLWDPEGVGRGAAAPESCRGWGSRSRVADVDPVA